MPTDDPLCRKANGWAQVGTEGSEPPLSRCLGPQEILQLGTPQGQLLKDVTQERHVVRSRCEEGYHPGQVEDRGSHHRSEEENSTEVGTVGTGRRGTCYCGAWLGRGPASVGPFVSLSARFFLSVWIPQTPTPPHPQPLSPVPGQRFSAFAQETISLSKKLFFSALPLQQLFKKCIFVLSCFF